MEDGEDISSKANGLIKDITRLKKELKEIQEICTHPEYKLEIKKQALIKICTVCHKKLGYPDEKDKKDAGYIN